MLSTIFMELGCLASYGFLISLIVFLLVVGSQAIQCLFLFRTFKKHNIPGPKPSLFSGNYFELRTPGITACDTIGRWIKTHGNVFGYFAGAQPVLVINDLEILKEIFVRRFNEFTNRPPFCIPVKPIVDSVLLAKGGKWKNDRKILTPSFSASKMRLMGQPMNRSVNKLIEVLEDCAINDEMVDINERVQAMTLDIVGECALAMNVDCQRNPRDKFLNAVKEYFQFASNPAVLAALFFPILSYPMRFINNYLTAGQMTDMIVENLKHIIDIRRSDSSKRRVDMLQLMLDSDTEKTKDNLGKEGFNDTEIIANAHIFMLAGFETTATALAFTFYLLAQHPEIQQRLAEEIISKVKDKEDLSYDEIGSLTYLDQVFHESLRYYPPVVLFQTRLCEADCSIGKVFIPKNVTVLAPVWQIHHDPEIWPDPFKFDPERFSPENKPNIPFMAFLPFGAGPRNCIGMRFALLEAKLTIAKVIRRFKVIPCEMTEDPLKLSCPTVINNPENGVIVKVVARK